MEKMDEKYRPNPTLQDKVHCVVFVTNDVPDLHTEKTLLEIQTFVEQRGKYLILTILLLRCIHHFKSDLTVWTICAFWALNPPH